MFSFLSGSSRALSKHGFLAILFISLPITGVQAQTNLVDYFNQAWQRQADLAALPARLEAADARAEFARQWLAGPPSVDIGYRSDQLQRNRGAREWDVGLAAPLWLPGERQQLGVLAAQERVLIEKNLTARQLLFAQEIRQLWWQSQLSQVELLEARRRFENNQQLTSDVTRRFSAGALARTDLLQAQAAEALAQSALMSAENQALEALRLLRERLPTLSLPNLPAASQPEPVPTLSHEEAITTHPLLLALDAARGLAQAERNVALVQRRSNPEIGVAARADRSGFGEAYLQSSALTIRIPFGSDSRVRARVADASAQQIHAEIAWLRLREQLPLLVETQLQRWRNAAIQVEAAQQRAQLAEETRQLLDKSFRLGQTDLPTRLRVELEAFEAQRLAQRTRIEQAALLSEWRQSLGLLPTP